MAVDMFLKLDGVTGESLDAKHAGWIDVLSFTWGASQPVATGGGGATGKVQFNQVTVVKVVDTATPQLIEMICKGQHAPSATLKLRKAGEKPLDYLVIKLTDVLIANYQTGGTGGGIPAEAVSFSFASMDMTALKQNADGSIGGSVQASCHPDTQA